MPNISDYRHPMPKESDMSSGELALCYQIMSLHKEHEKHIGKIATLKKHPQYEVKITEVIKSDYGIPRLHFDIITNNGKPVNNNGFRGFVNQIVFPSSALEGEMNIPEE
tara:strand:+ start:698 stop:1024 length:327 start_codon:yes stop_codon:yes gene_type:complete